MQLFETQFVPFCRAMFTVEQVTLSSEPGTKLKDTISWLKGDQRVEQDSEYKVLDAKEAIAAIARDAGPTFLCHMNVRAETQLLSLLVTLQHCGCATSTSPAGGQVQVAPALSPISVTLVPSPWQRARAQACAHSAWSRPATLGNVILQHAPSSHLRVLMTAGLGHSGAARAHQRSSNSDARRRQGVYLPFWHPVLHTHACVCT
jgi:hypothetical protein